MNMNTNQTKLHTLGIDIGSTTVKVAILNEKNELLFSDYERHFANIQETLSASAWEKLFMTAWVELSGVA